jgi:hypothetical protein
MPMRLTPSFASERCQKANGSVLLRKKGTVGLLDDDALDSRLRHGSAVGLLGDDALDSRLRHGSAVGLLEDDALDPRLRYMPLIRLVQNPIMFNVVLVKSNFK